MIKKILIIGIKGMAGHVIHKYFSNLDGFDVYGIARNIESSNKNFNLDVSDINELREIIQNSNFDYIINCIGILNKDAEDNPSKSIWFNSYFPHFLEEITANSSTKIIHISTDCVFNGKKGGYTENDVKDGIGFYAQTKSLGEINNEKDLTIRTSIIGPELTEHGIGLFHWFMMTSKNSILKGYSQAYWSGITTLELAEVIENALLENITGLIQVAPASKIDKYNLLLLFNTLYRENKMVINIDDSYKVDKSLVSIREDFSYKVRDYHEMLLRQKEWIRKDKQLYSHYTDI